MAFMFKGPAALTSGSTVTAAGASTFASTVGITGNTTVGGTFGVTGAVSTTAGVTVGNALTVSGGGATITGNSSFAGSSTLSVGGLLTASGGIQIAGNQLTSIDPGTGGGGDNLIIASKLSVTQAITAAGSGGGLTATTVTASTAAFTIPTLTGNRHFRFNAAGYNNTTGTNMTCDFTGASPSDDATYKLSWHVQSGNSDAGYISVDFGAGKILDAAGTAVRYIRLSNIGSAIKLHYSTLGGHDRWLIIGGSGAMPTNSAPS
jgi:hypothetical protein